MATFSMQKQRMNAGSFRESQEVVVPSGLSEIRIELDMNNAEARDPTTNVRAVIYWYDERLDAQGQPRGWREAGSTQVIGNPNNNVNTLPFIAFGATDCAFFAGKRVKGRIEAISEGSYGATVRTT